MNPFSNNRPRLTASESLRNKRDKTIYQAEKQRFQNHKTGGNKTGGNKNIKYYDNGTIRSMQGYKLQKSLARGNVLCEDCDDRGMLCGKITNKSDFATIHMGNNAVSEYWGGGVNVYTPSGESIVSTDPSSVSHFIQGLPVVVADVEGSWDPSAVDWKGDIPCSVPPDCSYGYMPNEIAIPRNLDGSGIVIDPSNILFPDELCDPFRYLQKSYLKTYLVIRGGIDFFNSLELGAPGTGEGFNGDGGVIGKGPQSCAFKNTVWQPGPIYQYMVGSQVFLSEDLSKNPIVNGIIKSLCCIKEINMNIGPSTGTLQQSVSVGIFDMYVELSYINNMSFLSKLINYKPQYYPDKVPNSAQSGNNSGWDWMPLCSAALPSACGNHAPFFLALLDLGHGWSGRIAHTTYNYIESFKLIQGTIPPSSNQTKYNATKQSYMSCLEDGTRKINFTKNTVKQNNVNIAYCKEKVPE
jgi:hypothetical protein